jgi:hypothetical protein
MRCSRRRPETARLCGDVHSCLRRLAAGGVALDNDTHPPDDDLCAGDPRLKTDPCNPAGCPALMADETSA